MGTSTRDVVLSSFVGSFPWPRVDHGERCRNHKYNALHGRIDLYQSTCSEFRYGDGKVLGTQPVGQLPLIVFQVLISLKGSLICYSNSTHALA